MSKEKGLKDIEEIEDSFKETKKSKPKSIPKDSVELKPQESSGKKNIFQKAYQGLESSYFKTCDWFSSKGINLNKLNEKLESKGIPAFAFMGSLFLIIIFLIIFFVFFGGIKSNISGSFSLKDSGSFDPINGVSFTITDSQNKEVFYGTINNGDITKLPLKIGKTYTFLLKKSGYNDLKKEITISSKDQQFSFNLGKKYDTGLLTVKVLDKQYGTGIANATITLEYIENGETKTPEQKTSAENDYMVTFSVPIGVSIDIEATADSYQTTQQTSYKLNEKEQLIEIEMDASTVSLQGKSTITFMVIDKDTSIPLDDALVQVYHLNSTILLGEDTTQAGSAQIQIDSGTPVSYIVSKEGYRSIDGNYTVRTDYTISVVLELGGSTLDVTVLDGITNNPLNNVQVNIFSQSKNKLDGNLTDVSGNVKFNGLPEDDVVYVSACYTQQDFSYFCKTDIVDLKTTNQKTITLERRIQQNTRLLYVFINDFFNNPLPDAQVNIYQIVGDKELPYGDTYYLDSSGAATVPLKIGDKFLVVGTYKDVNASKVITITDETENKVILVIDTKSRLLNLQIININGTKVTEGNVLVKSKDDVVLYSEPLTTEDIFFESKGYTEFLTEYTDQNGNTFSSVLTPSPDNILLFVIRPQVIGNYPVIDFVGIEDSYGKRVPYISVDQDYFLIFNVLFPEGSTNGGVHIRVGEDNETDIENMSYGITGYVADKAKARYGTTYLPPTNASIDYLNVGEPGKLNKFLELTFSDKYSIGNRQIKVRVKALDLSQYKLKFNYRAWVSLDSNVYRYPKDTTLGDRLNSIEKQGLYAQTNSVEIDLFENPANCMNEFCISYQFIDEEMFNYPKDKFFGIQGNVYALEAVLYSLKNTSVDLYAETSPTNPLISFVSVSNNLNFPIISNSDISPQLDISQTGISLSSFQRQKVYLFFISQTPGVSYIDLSWKIGGTQTINEKFSFNIYEKKEMQAVFDPNFILPYGSKLNITLTDLNTNKPIEDAFIKIYDNKDNLVYSLKGNKLNGANGKYVIDQEFVSPKLNIVVSKFGYIPITKQLIVQDNTYLKAPDQVIIHVGEGELTSAQAFQVTNTGKQLITGITVSDPIWVEQVDGLEFVIDHPSSLPPNKSFSFVANATISSESQFDSAQANFIISGMVGTKEVARVVSVIVNRKKLVDNCLSIKPKELNTYIGMMVDSENTSSFIITNSCQKDIMINPQVLNLSSATNNGIEILFEGVTINAGEEKSIDVTIKNLIERKQVKQYSYDIVWSNPYYILPTTKLNVSIIDVSKALIATPPVVYVPMSQLDTEQQAITTAQFFVKNIGTVPIYNIEIAHDPEYKTSYIGVQEYPRVINSLAPGQQLPITLKFQAMLKTTTLDDLYYTVKGNVPGLKEAVSSKTSIIFTISTPGCIKVEQTKLKYDIKIGESKAKTVTFVNQCAEPVIIEGIDKREMTYFQTFGYNPVFLTPIYMQGVTVPNVGVQAPIVSPYNVSTSSSVGLGVIPVGGTASYSLKIQGVTYGGTPGADMPIKFIGKLANSGLYASSQSILINLNIYEPDKEKQNDLRQTNQGIPIPVCGNEDEVRYYNVPKVNEGTCTGTNGYCDAQEAGKLLIKKVEELHTKVLQAAAQSNYNVEKSGCSREFASKGYCSISQLGSGTIEPIEFTLYLQNDAITPDLISKLLEKANYKIKDFLIVPSSLKQMPSEVYGLSVIGNQLYLSENLSGCGRYKITIDGFIGSTPTQLLPQKANYYIIVEDYNRTEQCTKQITNYLNFMPKDTEFKKLQNPNTWLTVFIGDKNIGKAVAKSFLDEDRYSESKSLVSKNNIINIDTEELLINGEKTDALAKIIFNDPVLNTVSEPQQLNIIINNVYQTKKNTDTEEAVLPEKVVSQATSLITSFLLGQDITKVCISEDETYLLILNVLKAGELKITPKEQSVAINLDNPSCKSYNINSGIDESVLLTLGNVPDHLDAWFVYNDKAIREKLPLDLKSGIDSNFDVCIKPQKGYLDVYSFVGHEIDITANSVYITEQIGSISKRKADAKLIIESCGVTPLELITEIYKRTSQGISTNSKDSSFSGFTAYALVSWDNKYNAQDEIPFCDVLQEFINNNQNASMFFDYKNSGCSMPTAQIEKKERNKIAREKAATYEAACLAGCGAAQFGVSYFIPVLGQAKYMTDFIFNCGLGCTIPAAAIYLGNGGSLFGATADSGFIETISEGFSKFGSAVSSAWEGVIGAFSGTRLARKDRLTVYSEKGFDTLENVNVKKGVSNIDLDALDKEIEDKKTKINQSLENIKTQKKNTTAKTQINKLDDLAKKENDKLAELEKIQQNIKNITDTKKSDLTKITNQIEETQKKIADIDSKLSKTTLETTGGILTPESVAEHAPLANERTAAQKTLNELKQQSKTIQSEIDAAVKDNVAELKKYKVKTATIPSNSLPAPTKWGRMKTSKLGTFGFGMLKGIASTAAGNSAGVLALNLIFSDKQLSNSLVIPTTDEFGSFEKNVLYTIKVISSDSKDHTKYMLTIEKYQPGSVSSIKEEQRLDNCCKAIKGSEKIPIPESEDIDYADSSENIGIKLSEECPDEYKQVDPLLCNFTLYKLTPELLQYIDNYKQEAKTFLNDPNSNFNKYFNNKNKYIPNSNNSNNLFDKVTDTLGLKEREKAIVFANNMGESKWNPKAKASTSVGLCQIEIPIWRNENGYNTLKPYIDKYYKNNLSYSNYLNDYIDNIVGDDPQIIERALVLCVALNSNFAKRVNSEFSKVSSDLQINKDFLTFYIYRVGNVNYFTKGIPSTYEDAYATIGGQNKDCSKSYLRSIDVTSIDHVLCTSLQRLGWYLGYLEYVGNN